MPVRWWGTKWGTKLYVAQPISPKLDFAKPLDAQLLLCQAAPAICGVGKSLWAKRATLMPACRSSITRTCGQIRSRTNCAVRAVADHHRQRDPPVGPDTVVLEFHPVIAAPLSLQIYEIGNHRDALYRHVRRARLYLFT